MPAMRMPATHCYLKSILKHLSQLPLARTGSWLVTHSHTNATQALHQTKNTVDLELPENKIQMVSVSFHEKGIPQGIHTKNFKVARECFLNLLAMEARGMCDNFLDVFVLVCEFDNPVTLVI
jgi:hypothetical protein